MSLRKILVLDGVTAVCRFRDDGVIMEADGMLSPDLMNRMAKFAQWYRRMVSGNTDLLSLFSQMRGWSPSQGWIVHGTRRRFAAWATWFAWSTTPGFAEPDHAGAGRGRARMAGGALPRTSAATSTPPRARGVFLRMWNLTAGG
jgi:roadblock/LC7 domain-containing protein